MAYLNEAKTNQLQKRKPRKSARHFRSRTLSCVVDSFFPPVFYEKCISDGSAKNTKMKNLQITGYGYFAEIGDVWDALSRVDYLQHFRAEP